MAKQEISLDNVMNFIKALPFSEFKEIVKSYSEHTKTSFDEELNLITTLNLQDRLKELGVNRSCPKCNSMIVVKNGKRSNGIQEFKCRECNTKFTLFTGTILEKTRWHWDIWIKVLEMTLNNYSIPKMTTVLRDDYNCDGINDKTVWMWRLKLIHALASLPNPKLTGIVQVDETFVRESQKGSRELKSYIAKEERKPRYGRMPSKLGVMGPEFATITTAIDNRGYCVCKVSGLGRLTNEMFVDLFSDVIESPSFLCTDANDVYKNYCEMFDIPHYIKPSNYITIIEKHGYETPDWHNPAKAEATKRNNLKILSSLYSKNLIDKIDNRGYLTYSEFVELKDNNHLNLARVNELHSDLKKFLYSNMTNVSTKYLEDYVGYFTYIKNWSVKNGYSPTSNKDAEAIFKDILTAKVNLTVSEINNKILELPKPSGKYIAKLKRETEIARNATLNRYFKFNEEDGVKTFNKREYLLNLPKSKLYALCKECKFTHYKQLSTWTVSSMLLKHPDIDNLLYQLLQEDRHIKIDDEDLEAIATRKYAV